MHCITNRSLVRDVRLWGMLQEIIYILLQRPAGFYGRLVEFDVCVFSEKSRKRVKVTQSRFFFVIWANFNVFCWFWWKEEIKIYLPILSKFADYGLKWTVLKVEYRKFGKKIEKNEFVISANLDGICRFWCQMNGVEVEF